jgi:hypothetical protein
MASQEFTTAEIGQSLTHISEVYRYAKGEEALPIQDPLLEQKYISALGRYFEYTQRALTDPDVVALMQRSRVGMHRGDGSAYLARVADNAHIIAKGHYSQSNIVALVTDPTPRLVYNSEETLYPRSLHKGKDLEEKKAKWQAHVVEKLVSRDGLSDWTFGEGTDQYEQYLYLYAYRTMGAGDLLFHGMIPTFVRGIRDTFSQLKQAAVEEVAVKFDGIKDIDRIKEIIGAFNQANEILDKVFNPVGPSSVSTVKPSNRGRRKAR